MSNVNVASKHEDLALVQRASDSYCIGKFHTDNVNKSGMDQRDAVHTMMIIHTLYRTKNIHNGNTPFPI